MQDMKNALQTQLIITLMKRPVRFVIRETQQRVPGNCYPTQNSKQYLMTIDAVHCTKDACSSAQPLKIAT